MEYTAGQIAKMLQGKVVGNEQVKVSHVSKIEEGQKGTISFLANSKYESYIYDSEASIIIVSKSFKPTKKVKATLIEVDDPYNSFGQLLEIYNKIKYDKKGISKKAHIARSAKIGKNVYIEPGCFVGENVVIGASTKVFSNTYIGDSSKIGKDCILFAGVKLYADTNIGDNCILHSGVVIGSDGFGFAQQSDENYEKISQIGNVVIENHVEIGANTTIDRATLGSTIIRKGVKLDNLIQIAHNVEIGENTVIAAQTGISGSTKIGKNCMIGGQVGIVGHITIADNVKIAAQSGIGASIKKEGEIVQGSPAFNIGEYKRAYVLFRNLTSIEKRLRVLENKKKT